MATSCKWRGIICSFSPTVVVVETVSHSGWSSDIPGCDPDKQQPASWNPHSSSCVRLQLPARVKQLRKAEQADRKWGARFVCSSVERSGVDTRAIRWFPTLWESFEQLIWRSRFRIMSEHKRRKQGRKSGCWNNVLKAQRKAASGIRPTLLYRREQRMHTVCCFYEDCAIRHKEKRHSCVLTVTDLKRLSNTNETNTSI